MALENYVDELKKKHAKLSLKVDHEQKKTVSWQSTFIFFKKGKIILKRKNL